LRDSECDRKSTDDYQQTTTQTTPLVRAGGSLAGVRNHRKVIPKIGTTHDPDDSSSAAGISVEPCRRPSLDFAEKPQHRDLSVITAGIAIRWIVLVFGPDFLSAIDHLSFRSL
jgi:hypothetical protein